MAIAVVKGVSTFITEVLAMNAKDVATTASMLIQSQSDELKINRSEFMPPVHASNRVMPKLADKSSIIEMLLASYVLTRTPLNVANSPASNAEAKPKIIPR